MPTYDYKREDGSIFEITQRITDASLKLCPTTGQSVKRIISGGAGLIFNGSGFYSTDYGSKKNENNNKSKGSSSQGEDS